MPDGEFLDLLHSIELGRRNVDLPSMAVDYPDVEKAKGLDESKRAHAIETENTPCDSAYCPRCENHRMQRVGMREGLKAKGIEIPQDVWDSGG